MGCVVIARFDAKIVGTELKMHAQAVLRQRPAKLVKQNAEFVRKQNTEFVRRQDAVKQNAKKGPAKLVQKNWPAKLVVRQELKEWKGSAKLVRQNAEFVRRRNTKFVRRQDAVKQNAKKGPAKSIRL